MKSFMNLLPVVVGALLTVPFTSHAEYLDLNELLEIQSDEDLGFDTSALLLSNELSENDPADGDSNDLKSGDEQPKKSCLCPLNKPTENDCPKCTRKDQCSSYVCGIVKLPKEGDNGLIVTASCIWGTESKCSCPSDMQSPPAGASYVCGDNATDASSVDCKQVNCFLKYSNGTFSDTGKACK